MTQTDFPAFIMPAGLGIADSEVHVWLVALDRWDDRVSSLSRLLSGDEWSRARRFYFEADRHRFIIKRGCLRKLLSLYLGIAPGQIRFSYGPHGKPYLSRELHRSDLHFSLSHSHGLAIYAIIRSRRIGIDLEVFRELPDLAHMAACFFCSEESAHLRQLSPNLQVQRFFHWWTLKEAYLKAMGTGLTYPLNRLRISLDPAGPPRLLEIDSPLTSPQWSLRLLSPTGNSVAALALEGREYSLKCHSLQPPLST